MYVFLLILIALLFWNIREPFTVHIEGELPKIPYVNVTNVLDTVHSYTVKPVYESVVNMIPYKNHYRKFRRNLKKM